MKLSKEVLSKYLRSEFFFNRDLSWLEFNRKVLQEATNPNLPLLDRIKFISIFFSNLDEFYMIRVAGIKEQIRAKVIDTSFDGLTPTEQLKQIENLLQPMLKEIYEYWQNVIIPELRENKIYIYDFNKLSKDEKEILNEYFLKEIYPVLTPLAFDPGRPFPYISNLSISLAVRIKKPNGEKNFARIKVPSNLPRLLQIDKIIRSKGKNGSNLSLKFIWIGDLIKANLQYLFPGLEVIESYKFRITRDTDLEIQ